MVNSSYYMDGHVQRLVSEGDKIIDISMDIRCYQSEMNNQYNKLSSDMEFTELVISQNMSNEEDSFTHGYSLGTSEPLDMWQNKTEKAPGEMNLSNKEARVGGMKVCEIKKKTKRHWNYN